MVAAGGGEAPGDNLNDAVDAAEEMLAEGAAEDAAQTFAAVLGEEPNHAAAYGGLVRAHIALEDLDQAEAVLNGAPADISGAPELEAAHAQLELARQAANAGPLDDLRAEVEKTPDNHQARFDLALALHANDQVEAALADRPGARPETLVMNPGDAAARGIQDGDLIRIYNDRGACLSVALLSADLRLGVIELPTGAWFNPADPKAEKGLEIHGNPNVLTRDAGTSQLAQGPSAFG